MTTTNIKVIGLGGGGSNAIDRMIEFGIQGVQFIAANTDAQALAKSQAEVKLLLGQRTRRGLGAGGDPQNGEVAAEESVAEIRQALTGADMVFLTAGMGGGTGTGSIGVAARIARELGAITVAIVTAPFSFEASKRSKNAQWGLAKLREHCHSLIVVPNDKLLNIVDRSVTLADALRVADEVLRQGVQGMVELITRPSTINVDFANVCSLMQMPGGAFLAIGNGKGLNKAADAVTEMLNHKLLDPETLTQASGVLVHFTGGSDLTLHEITQAVTMIRKSISDDAMFVMGVMTDENMVGRAQIILVATGVGAMPLDRPQAVEEALMEVAVPAPMPVKTAAVSATQPEAGLAHSLFATVQPTTTWALSDEPQPPTERLVGNPKPALAEEEQFASAMPTLAPDNLDLPAFLRRRRAGQK